MRARLATLLLPAALLALTACGSQEQAQKAPAASTPAAESATAPLSSDELKLKLASADALDGAEDQVVTRCSGCRLGMNGKAEHPISVEGYTLHMCSASCKAHFEKDLQGNLAALEIPQS